MLLAEIALGKLQHVLLEDALQPVDLDGEVGNPKYEPAARNYLARWSVGERPSPQEVAATACSSVERRARESQAPYEGGGTCRLYRTTAPALLP